ncbi:MAG TPA: sigma 54-interacting transcriptional regulator [Candidatus Hydrogenedentes bacterium]|nr:sigma 54-interacting transcriptional regulator [Candidatus Hydrogenedentota bacterium]
MKPTKVAPEDFARLSDVLRDYANQDRAPCTKSCLKEGRLSLMGNRGIFTDLESLAVERRQLIAILGLRRARALCYRTGFEQGRRDAARHLGLLGREHKAALQCPYVFGQLQGLFVAEHVQFDFDRAAGRLHHEFILHASAEALAHGMARPGSGECGCWTTAGYFGGHTSELLGLRVIALETECKAHQTPVCRFVCKLASKWGPEAKWPTAALHMESIDQEVARRERASATASRPYELPPALSVADGDPPPGPMLDDLVAECEPMHSVMRKAAFATRSDVPVLLVGEPGTGKETLAEAIHYAGQRGEEPFVAVDSAGLSRDLLNQELLGGLSAETRAEPPAGTLYFPEISEVDVNVQSDLLQAIREHKYCPPEGQGEIEIHVRVIAATHQDPLALVASGALNENLYQTLAACRIDIPPLRNRSTDILRMAESFLHDARERFSRPGVVMSEQFKRALLECQWPGNISQLRDAVEHAVLMGGAETLGLETLPGDVLAAGWRRAPRELTREVVQAALRETKGNRSLAAQLLGVGRTTLWRAMKRMEMP